MTLALNGLAIADAAVRWNPGGEERRLPREAAQPAAAATPAATPSRTRRVWDNPILWREIRTWAYGRKMLLIRLAYILLFGLAAAGLHATVAGEGSLGAATAVLATLLLLSLVLVNAQSVTSMTSERDCRALDLLLVSDLTPKELVFGKLGGIFYNTKEMVLLPLALCGYLWLAGELSLENLLYVLGGSAVLYFFVAVLGLHAGMNYENSRTAIATSLGTVFFLFLGVATCMRIITAFSGQTLAQLQPFLVFMIGGGVGLYVALGPKSLDRHRRGLLPLPPGHLLCHYQLPLGLYAGRVPGDRGGLRLHHGRHAYPRRLRIRRCHRANNGKLGRRAEEEGGGRRAEGGRMKKKAEGGRRKGEGRI